MFVISAVTSLGSVVLPIAFAFGILGRQIAREHTTYAVGAGHAVGRRSAARSIAASMKSAEST